MKKIYSIVASLIFVTALSAQTTFNFTGAAQTYTVPACVTTIIVDARGAAGGTGATSPGGLGGRVQATISVTPGEILYIYVGEVGANNQGAHPGVYNGGAGVFSYSSGGTSGTGGGGTDIRRAPYTVNDRLVVAGGGGGGGYQNGNGGNGGGLIGLDGIPFPSWPNSGGKGGTQLAGGQQGIACCSCPTYTTAGTLGAGGAGSGDGAGGGGGGGGYYGGGGSCFAGGGGGSSYAEPSATAVTHNSGFQPGNGQLVVTAGPSGSMPASPTAIAGSTSHCAGSTTTFSINPVGGATGYTWTVPAGSTINSGQGTTTINVTFGTTSGNVAVTADNACGSSAPTSQAITINPLPVVALGPDVTACSGATADAGNSGSTYLWSNGTTNQILSVSFSGVYTVTVTTVNGCTGSDAISVTINTPPVAALGVNITQCGGTVTLDPQVSGATYLWSDASTNQTLLASTSGTYFVNVTDANGCSDSDTILVTINPIPTVSGSAANDSACVADGSIALMGMPMGGTWSGPGVSGNQFDPSTAGVGTHTAQYVYVDSMSCTDSATVTIIVDVCLGLAGNSGTPAITVYPNPATEQLQLISDQPLLNYSVVDVSGRQVMSGSCNSAVTVYINVQELAAGTYVLQTTGVNGVVVKTQFVKK